MGDVFKAVGMLPTNNLIEVDRGKLVAAYTDKPDGQACSVAVRQRYGRHTLY